ncbi:circadian clock protein KaiC [Methylomonas montana]|uniref:circadian clock protein KaiC n=1 Tax=Methylomonas montana TaxID=3058963 RepID=UPI002659AE3D|nr:circadian clock protein KaiC [Methylomonas montana]WKJ91688.1 circadian clock protein KaiC [Methylomonas montana]
MNSTPPPLMKPQAKAPSGISGFDDITGGGLPHGRTTLLVGGPGSGKTIFALQFLEHGAQDCQEPGIFVAFEESSQRIVANAESFGWKLDELQEKSLFFMDAQPSPDLVQSGDFDLGGMLAALEVQIGEMGARRIVFDALDILLVLLPDQAAIRREIYRLHEWLLAHEMTGLITLKADGDQTSRISQQPFGFMQFMVDCAVILNHNVELGISQRSLRVQKYRGSSFDENESPFLIGKKGFEVAVARTLDRMDANVTNERVSSGVTRLDTMLGGGYYRGASVLITGFSGTAKTTLSGTFAEAACRRGERTLFVSFDSDGTEVIRNLASVGIRLDDYVKNGCLRMVSARAITGSAETYLVRIKTLAQEHEAVCLVIDPVSTWSKSGNDLSVQSVAERLIDWSKAEGTTLVCTRLLDEMSSLVEAGSPLQISSIVDTWIHLNYLVQAGERNRGLSIVKSRGMAHSNQVRELILSDAGVTLADTYTAGGEVLMGTLRWEKESAERIAHEAHDAAVKLKRVKLDAEEADLEVRLKSLQAELVAKQTEKALLVRATLSHEGELSQSRTRMQELRGADGETVTGVKPQ